MHTFLMAVALLFAGCSAKVYDIAPAKALELQPSSLKQQTVLFDDGLYRVEQDRSEVVAFDDSGLSQKVKLNGASAFFDGKWLIVLDKSNALHIYQDGKKLLTKPHLLPKILNQTTPSPVKVGDIIYIPLLSGRLVVFDALKSVIKDELVLAEDAFDFWIDLKASGGVVVGIGYSKALRIDTKTQELRYFNALYPTALSVAPDVGSFYIGVAGGKIYELDRRSKLQERLQLKRADLSHLGLFDQKLVAVDKAGYLSVIDQTFEVKAIYQNPKLINVSIKQTGQSLYGHDFSLDMRGL